MKFSLAALATVVLFAGRCALAEDPSMENLSELINAKAWTDTLSRERGLDRCAGAIALGLDRLPGFDPAADWPFVCNDHRNDKEMLKRVQEISADLQSGKFSDEQLNALRAGKVPFGCAIDGMYYVYGRPDSRRRSSTAEGIEEVFVYALPSDSKITFTFYEGKLTRIEE